MISVILPIFESNKIELSLLHDLERQITSFAFEVIIIFDRKNINLKSIIGKKQHPYIKYKWDFIELKNKCKAINRGIRLSSFDYVYILDENIKIDQPNYLQQVYNFIDKNKNISGVGGLLRPNGSKIFKNKFYKYWNSKILERKLTSSYTTYLYLLNCCFRKAALQGNILNESVPFLSASYLFFCNMLENRLFLMEQEFMALGFKPRFTFLDYIKINISEGFEYNQCLKNLYKNMPSHTDYYKIKPHKAFFSVKHLFFEYGKYLFSYTNKNRNLYLHFPIYFVLRAFEYAKKAICQSFLKEAYIRSKKYYPIKD